MWYFLWYILNNIRKNAQVNICDCRNFANWWSLCFITHPSSAVSLPNLALPLAQDLLKNKIKKNIFRSILARRAFCKLIRDEEQCKGGSYIDEFCGKTMCYRLPGEVCDMPNSSPMNGNCHPLLTCNCGKCWGCVNVNGVRMCDEMDLCSVNKKFTYQKKHSNLFNSDYYYW